MSPIGLPKLSLAASNTYATAFLSFVTLVVTPLKHFLELVLANFDYVPIVKSW